MEKVIFIAEQVDDQTRIHLKTNNITHLCTALRILEVMVNDLIKASRTDGKSQIITPIVEPVSPIIDRLRNG